MEPTKVHTEADPLIGADIIANGTGKVKVLSHTDSTAVVCLFFPYNILTPVNVAHAMNDAGVRMNRYGCRFDPETPPTMGQRRMNSKFIREKYPEWVALAEAQKIDLKSYVLLRLHESSEYGKRGELPPDKRAPGTSRKGDRAEARNKGTKRIGKGNRFTPPKKKRKKKK